MVITVGLRQQTAFDAIKDLKDRFRTRVRVAPEIATLPVDVIHQITHPAMSRKPVTLFDNRAK